MYHDKTLMDYTLLVHNSLLHRDPARPAMCSGEFRRTGLGFYDVLR